MSTFKFASGATWEVADRRCVLVARCLPRSWRPVRNSTLARSSLLAWLSIHVVSAATYVLATAAAFIMQLLKQYCKLLALSLF